MRTGAGDNLYEWIDHWARYPDTESARTGWAHPGIVVTASGHILTSHPGEPAVLVYDGDGVLQHSWKVNVAEVHHILLVEEGDVEYLWITDNGSKRQPGIGYEYPADSPTTSGQALKTTLDGRMVMKLALPDLPDYRGGRCAPTAIAVNEERHGGNGDIWVADGYGKNYVHRYDKSGAWLGSISGEEGAGKFNCPHGIFIDRRKSDPELYVADRASARVQVYDLEGVFKRVFGADFLRLPSTFVSHDDRLIIGELSARLTIVDREDNFMGYLGANEAVCDVAGWPNNRDDQGRVVPTRLLTPGRFNSPHGLAVNRRGDLYVAEWLIDGRMTKLERVDE